MLVAAQLLFGCGFGTQYVPHYLRPLSSIRCPTTARGGSLVRTRFSLRVQRSFPGLFFNAVHQGTLPLANVGSPNPFFKVARASYQYKLVYKLGRDKLFCNLN